MRISDRFSIATSALRDNRRRTLMSVLGISIGIIAVIIVGTISKGGNFLIFSELETFGLKSVWIYRDYNEKDPNQRQRKGSGISKHDYQLLTQNCCRALQRISPIVNLRQDNIIHASNHYSNAEIMGIDTSFIQIANEHLLKGRAFRKQDVKSRRGFAVIGLTSAKDLFGSNENSHSIIGKQFSIGRHKVIVIGVLKEKNREFLSSIGSAGNDVNNRILLPYTFVQKINANQSIDYLRAQAVSRDQADLAASQIIRFLSHLNAKKYNYKKQTMASYSKTAEKILANVSLIGLIAASVSLLVGGMGIMNMMSTSVLERTREIGLRKAIGASQLDILLQFLMEAVFISIIGGILGMLLGYAGSIALAKMIGFPAAPAINTVLLALSVSILLGIVSGYFPARKAARKAPVEALRYE